MRKSKEIAQEVRKSLKGNLANAGFTYFIYVIFVFLLSFGISVGVEPFIAKLAQDKPIISAVILLVIEIVVAIIEMAIFYGCLVVLIKLKRGEKVSAFSCIPEGLKKIHRVFAIDFWISLKLLFWIVVLFGVIFGVNYLDGLGKLNEILVPAGITAIVLVLVSVIMLTIQSYKYMLSFIILYDNPDLSDHKIVNKSRDMMKGRKGKLFGIQLKYVLLAILITILFAIVLGMIAMVFGLATYKICEMVYEVVATILLAMYMQMANICFYEEIISEEKEKELDEVGIV